MEKKKKKGMSVQVVKHKITGQQMPLTVLKVGRKFTRVFNVYFFYFNECLFLCLCVF